MLTNATYILSKIWEVKFDLGQTLRAAVEINP